MATTDRPHQLSLDPATAAAALSDLLALKDVRRQGWVDHGVPVAETESVADHSWGMALLAVVLPLPPGVDRGRLLQLIALHDVAEVVVGDLTPATAPPGKLELELSALSSLLQALSTAGVLGGADREQLHRQMGRALQRKAAVTTALRASVGGAVVELPPADDAELWLARLDLLERLLQAWRYRRQGQGSQLVDFAVGPSGLEGTALQPLGAWLQEQLRR